MTISRMTLAVRVACYLCLASLALMAWSLLDPTPIPVILAMSVGQAVGTLAFLIFLLVVAVDLRKRLAVRTSIPPSRPSDRGAKSGPEG